MSGLVLSERQQLRYLKEQADAAEQAKQAEQQSLKEAARVAALKLKKAQAKQKQKEKLQASKAEYRKKEKEKKKRAKERKKARDKANQQSSSSSSSSSASSSSSSRAKAATTTVKKTNNPSKSKLTQQIRVLLKTVDVQVTTAKTVRKALEKIFGCDLKPRKSEVTELLKEIMNEDPEGEEAPKKKGGYTKVYQVSSRLSTLLGSSTKLMLTRNDLVKELFVYMKEHNCQNQKDKRQFLLNKPLQAIFKIKECTYFSINKYIGGELTDNNPSARSKKRKAAAAASSSSSSSSSSNKAGGKKKSGKSKTKTKKGGKVDKKKKLKDPNAPKRNKNGFMFFSGEKRAEVVAANPGDTLGDVAKKIGALWRGLEDGSKEKGKFEKLAAKDKIRYTAAMAKYVPAKKYQ
jgi:chromatin remodeling complex protein RSC6